MPNITAFKKKKKERKHARTFFKKKAKLLRHRF